MENMQQTLCWFCANAVPNKETGAGCPWSKHFKPVPGWDARPTIVTMFSGYGYYKDKAKLAKSYHVKSCPLYKPDSEVTPMTHPKTMEGEPARVYKKKARTAFPDGKRIFYAVQNVTDGIFFNTLDDAIVWIIANRLPKPKKDGTVATGNIRQYMLKKNSDAKRGKFRYLDKEWRMIPKTSRGELRDED